MSGYTWWLLQDYWTGANGIVDAYFRPKPAIRPELVRQFNAPVVLLQRGIDLSYRGGDKLAFDLLVRNDSLGEIEGAEFECAITSPSASEGGDAGAQSGKSDLHSTMFGIKKTRSVVPHGELTKLNRCEVDLPKVSRPRCVRVSAGITWPTGESRNEWTTWVYPNPAAEAPAGKSGGGLPLYASRDLLESLRPFAPAGIPAKGDLLDRAVYVVTQPSPRVLDAVARGASAIVLNSHGLIPSVPNRFKTAWWLGGPGDWQYRDRGVRELAGP
jgi:hypothetical protein